MSVISSLKNLSNTLNAYSSWWNVRRDTENSSLPQFHLADAVILSLYFIHSFSSSHFSFILTAAQRFWVTSTHNLSRRASSAKESKLTRKEKRRVNTMNEGETRRKLSKSQKGAKEREDKEKRKRRLEVKRLEGE